jgi:hypothetical protein
MNGTTFSMLRDVLLGVGFLDHSVPGKYARFDHPEEPDTWVLLRPYGPDDLLTQADLITAQRLLDERGIVSADRFDELLRDRSLASRVRRPPASV